MTRPTTDFIIIHCADTPADMDIGVNEIRRWHVEENGWADVGYHWIIRRDGTLEAGRYQDAIGAHARGYNDKSIGICMVGGKPDCNFTHLQWAALDEFVKNLILEYPAAEVIGHRDISDKTCPNFDAKSWWKEL